MKTKFTPGKRVVRKLTHCLAVFVEHSPSDRIMVCQVAETATKADEEDRAPFDARLIASAPELLTCCEALLASLLKQVKEILPPNYPIEESKLMIADGLSVADARAVITNATQ